MEQNNNFQNGSFQNGNFQNSNFQNSNFQNGSVQGNTELNNNPQYINQQYMTNHGPMLNGQPMSTDKMAAEMEKQENVLLGIIGAIGGALIGVAVMALCYYLNFVASYTGIIMGLCAIKGYEMLSGRSSVKGIIISAVVTVAMVYVGSRFCFAIALSEAFRGYNVFEAFIESGDKIAKKEIFAEAFNEILVQQYIYAGIGVVIAVASSISSRKSNSQGIGKFKK